MRASHPKNTAPCPEDLLAMLSVYDANICSNVRQLVLIGATLPISLAKQERSVYALRHIKSHMHASMGQNRLAGLTVMAVHSSHVQQMDAQPILQNYRQTPGGCSASQSCMSQ